MRALALAGVLALLPLPLGAQTYLVIVSGLGGEARYRTSFHETATTLIAAAQSRLGIPSDHIVYLAEQPARDSLRIAGRSTREEIGRVIDLVARRAEPNALVVVVLIGHGSASRQGARINLPGPDLTATEFAGLLGGFTTQRLAIVNTTSASGDWIGPLSGARRTVITATRSGGERNESYFGRHFADAFASDGADTDKNDRVSLLEAFEYARLEVARIYETEGRIRTEHALLDDDGDGKGTTEPSAQSGDGMHAARLFLDHAALSAAAAGDSVLAGLEQRRDSLQAALDALRGRREGMTAAAYDRALEDLLLEIARVGRAIRNRRPGTDQ